MKSRTSFFNKTIFKKNITLYWPLWGLYTIILFIMQPVMLWASYYSDPYVTRNKLFGLLYALDMESYQILVTIVAVFFGMALYNYLYSSKSANMMHSLPVDRKQLFGTNVISGLCFLIVPQVFTGLVSIAVCLAYGVKEIQYIGIWLVAMIAMSVINFSVVTFCAMFTGLLVALPFYVAIVNLLSYWAYGLFYAVVTVFGWGVYHVDSRLSNAIHYLSPVSCLANNVSFYTQYADNGECIGMRFTGWEVIIPYVIVAILLYFLAFKVYEKRHIEQAGDLITVSWVKPIFRWGVGISCGIFGAILIQAFFADMRISVPLAIFVIIMLLLGGISYFLADMLVKKNFRVFNKPNWIRCGKFSVTLLACFFALFGVAKYHENYIPDADEVKNVTLCMGYEMLLYDEDIEKVLEIHEKIIEHSGGTNLYYGEYDYDISFNYYMENGDRIHRSYNIVAESPEIQAIINEVSAMESNVETFLMSYLGENFEDVDRFQYGFLTMSRQNDMEQDEYGQVYGYDEIVLSEEQIKELYRAVIADARAGSLMKYNTYTIISGYIYSDVNVYMEYGVGDNNENFNSVHINFGPDCKNIINALIDFGYVDSADEIWWGDAIESK